MCAREACWSVCCKAYRVGRTEMSGSRWNVFRPKQIFALANAIGRSRPIGGNQYSFGILKHNHQFTDHFVPSSLWQPIVINAGSNFLLARCVVIGAITATKKRSCSRDINAQVVGQCFQMVEHVPSAILGLEHRVHGKSPLQRHTLITP